MDGTSAFLRTFEAFGVSSEKMVKIRKGVSWANTVVRFRRCVKNGNDTPTCFVAEGANRVIRTIIQAGGTISIKAGLVAMATPTGVTQVVGAVGTVNGINMLYIAPDVGNTVADWIVKINRPRTRSIGKTIGQRIIEENRPYVPDAVREMQLAKAVLAVTSTLNFFEKSKKAIMGQVIDNAKSGEIRVLDRVTAVNRNTGERVEFRIPIQTQALVYQAYGLHQQATGIRYTFTKFRRELGDYLQWANDTYGEIDRDRSERNRLLNQQPSIAPIFNGSRYEGMRNRYSMRHFRTSNPDGYRNGIQLGHGISIQCHGQARPTKGGSGGGGGGGGGGDGSGSDGGWELVAGAIMFTITLPFGGGGGATFCSIM